MCTIITEAGYPYIDITRSSSAPTYDPFWIQLEFSALTTVDFYDFLVGRPSFAFQGITVSDHVDPPPACFGVGTLVLCADGTRLDVATMHGTVQLLALPDGKDCDTSDLAAALEPIDVHVYFRDTVTHPEQVAAVAPSVFVSKEHTVCLVGRPAPASLRSTTSWRCMKGPYEGCAWMAKTLPDWSPKWTLSGLYHFVPVDPAHRQYGLIVGEDMSCAAEMFRSDASILTKRLHFVKKDVADTIIRS